MNLHYTPYIPIYIYVCIFISYTIYYVYTYIYIFTIWHISQFRCHPYPSHMFILWLDPSPHCSPFATKRPIQQNGKGQGTNGTFKAQEQQRGLLALGVDDASVERQKRFSESQRSEWLGISWNSLVICYTCILCHWNWAYLVCWFYPAIKWWFSIVV